MLPRLAGKISAASFFRGLIATAAVALTVWAEWGAVAPTSFFGNEELRDVIIRMRETVAPEPRILVVDIDEASLKALGPWPWPRARLADLVEILLTRYQARGVALDIVLPEPLDADGDTRLAMLARHGPLVLAQAFDYAPAGLRPEALRTGMPAAPLPDAGGKPAPGVAATGYLANHAGLARAAHVGNIGFIPDADGVLRRVPLLTSWEGHTYPALSLALLACCSGLPPPAVDGGSLNRVAFQRDWRAFTVVSVVDILAGNIDPASAGGRLVLIGSSSMNLTDRITTPFGASRPGLGVQASVLSELLDRQAGIGERPWPARMLALGFALAAALLSWRAFPRLSAWSCVALLAGLSLAWLAAAVALAPHDPALGVAGPLATNLFLLMAAVPFQWQLAQRRSSRLLDTLRQYVAPAVVHQLLQRNLQDPLEPQLLDVTTLIADMEGYTTQVELLSMEQAAQLTREFLDCLTGPVIERGGTLDKYTGDGLVAFWGAPLPVERHADLALAAASAIVARVAQLSAARAALGHPPLRVRIGIESGAAMAGDFGSSFRSIYTAVGDSVNTASRLEQAARNLPHDIIVGAGTVERARSHRFLSLGEHQLRGKGKPTTLYAIVDGNAAADGVTSIAAGLA